MEDDARPQPLHFEHPVAAKHDNAHDLLPEWLREQVPTLGSTCDQEDPYAMCKDFTPDAGWTWYVIEAGATDDLRGTCDYLLFGFVEGCERALGYFSLNELRCVCGPIGLA